jgi:hypothetical protein
VVTTASLRVSLQNIADGFLIGREMFHEVEVEMEKVYKKLASQGIHPGMRVFGAESDSAITAGAWLDQRGS